MWSRRGRELARVEHDLELRDGGDNSAARDLIRAAWPVLHRRAPDHADTKQAVAWLLEHDTAWFNDVRGEPEQLPRLDAVSFVWRGLTREPESVIESKATGEVVAGFLRRSALDRTAWN